MKTAKSSSTPSTLKKYFFVMNPRVTSPQKTSGKNNLLNQAKKAKKDEFYTQLTDIEKELRHYKEHFKNKTVLCNCDDPRVSNFFKYFVLNFKALGLKKLIATCYKNQNADLFSMNECETAVYLSIDADQLDKIIEQNDGYLTIDCFPEIETLPLKSDGDFRSPECVELLKEADIVCTNPPFSLFREYVAQLIKFDKKFLIIGHQNAITYKEIFPLIKNNQIWLGFGFAGGATHFISRYEDTATAGNHKDGMIRVSGVVWFTNLDFKKRHEELPLYKKYTPEEYPKYDNYAAIEVSKTKEIPEDYNGVMGVPITFLDKYCPEQFEILGATESEGKGFSNGLWDPNSKVAQPMRGGANSINESLSGLRIPGHKKYDRPYIGGVRKYFRILIKKRDLQ